MFMPTQSNDIYVNEDGIERKLEGVELDNFLTQKEKDNEAQELLLQKLEEIKAKKIAARAKLEALGLTADDLAALGL
jgi:hypothetical protein